MKPDKQVVRTVIEDHSQGFRVTLSSTEGRIKFVVVIGADVTVLT